MLNHGVAGIGAALRQQRIRNAIRESTVRRVMDFNEGHRHVKRFKAGFKGIHHWTCRTVAGVDNQLQRLEVREVDVAQQVVDIGVTQIDFFIAAAFGFVHRREIVGFRQTLNVAQAGIATDWAGALAHQLHAVVVHWVMAGGHFDPAINT